MLKYEELVSEIRSRTLPERLALLETLAQSLKEDMVQPALSANNAPLKSIENSLSNNPSATVATSSLTGLFKSPSSNALTDEEIREDYTNYLIEKYK